jgi:hypothetical protein
MERKMDSAPAEAPAGLALVASSALAQALKLTLLSYALAWLLASEPPAAVRARPGDRGRWPGRPRPLPRPCGALSRLAALRADPAALCRDSLPRRSLASA